MVSVWLAVFVAVFVNVTFAFGTTAPCESVTGPRTEPVLCAEMGAQGMTKPRKAAKQQLNRVSHVHETSLGQQPVSG